MWAFDKGMSFEQIAVMAKDAGYEAVEVTMEEEGILPVDFKKEHIKGIVDTAKKTKMELSSLATGLLWQYPLSSDDAEQRNKGKKIVKKALEAASLIGVDTVLTIPGVVHASFIPGCKVVSYDTVYKRSFSAISELADVAEKYKVYIGVENVWNKFLLSPLEMRDFVDKTKSKYVGVYFDVGNVVLTGLPEQWISILGKRIKKVHLKDFKSSIGTLAGFVDLTMGDVNWKNVVSGLKKTGYKGGYLVVEVFGGKEVLYRNSKYADKIFELI